MLVALTCKIECHQRVFRPIQKPRGDAVMLCQFCPPHIVPGIKLGDIRRGVLFKMFQDAALVGKCQVLCVENGWAFPFVFHFSVNAGQKLVSGIRHAAEKKCMTRRIGHERVVGIRAPQFFQSIQILRNAADVQIVSLFLHKGPSVSSRVQHSCVLRVLRQYSTKASGPVGLCKRHNAAIPRQRCPPDKAAKREPCVSQS